MPDKEINLKEVNKRLDLIIYLLITQRQEKDEATKKQLLKNYMNGD